MSVMIFNKGKLIFHLNNGYFRLLHSEIINIIEKKELRLSKSQEWFVEATLYCATGGIGFDVDKTLKTYKDADFFYQLVKKAIQKIEDDIPTLGEVVRERYWYFQDELAEYLRYLQRKKTKKRIRLGLYQNWKTRRREYSTIVYWSDYTRVFDVKTDSFKILLDYINSIIKKRKLQLNSFLIMLMNALHKAAEPDSDSVYLSHYLKTKNDALLFACIVQEAINNYEQNIEISRHLKICLNTFYNELIFYAQKLNNPKITLWDYCRYFLRQ